MARVIDVLQWWCALLSALVVFGGVRLLREEDPVAKVIGALQWWGGLWDLISQAFSWHCS